MLRAALRRFADARAGSILPLAGVMCAVVLGAVALSADAGALFLAKRRVQTAADIAALTGAQNPQDAERLVRLSLADNGVAAPDTLVVQTGRYGGDGALAPALRFQAGATPANAVRLSLSTRTPLFFGRAITGEASRPVAAAALATRADTASFAIGSRLLALDGGLANALLGALLGTRLSLSAMDYEALAGARLDAFSFSDALATVLGLQAVTYADVLRTQPTLPQVATAAVASLVGDGAPFPAISALRQVSAALAGVTTRVAVARLFDVGPAGQARTGSASGGLPVGLLDFLAAAAQVAGGARQVSVDLAPAIPGLLGARLTLGIGERPQNGSWTTAGPVGTTVRTQQTRLLLDATLTAPLGLGQIALPLYIEAAAAEATLAAISCPWSAAADGVGATLRVAPQTADAAIAVVAASAVVAGGPRPDLSRAATLVASPTLLPLVTVQGGAHPSTGSTPTAQSVVFSADDIARRRVRTVTSAGTGGAVASSLIRDLDLRVTIAGGLVTPTPASVQPAIAATLAAAAPGLDALLDAVLKMLGIGIGQADVWVSAVRCGRAVLVQ